MEIEFSSKRLAHASVSLSDASRFFGVPVGRKYIQRLAVLRAVEKFQQLYGLQALRLHPLNGDRGGQYAITLTGNFRPIIEKIAEDRINIVNIEDYHGD